MTKVNLAGKNGFIELQGVHTSVSSVAKFKVVILDDKAEEQFIGFGNHSVVYLPEMLGSWKLYVLNLDSNTTEFYIHTAQSLK